MDKFRNHIKFSSFFISTISIFVIIVTIERCQSDYVPVQSVSNPPTTTQGYPITQGFKEADKVSQHGFNVMLE